VITGRRLLTTAAAASYAPGGPGRICDCFGAGRDEVAPAAVCDAGPVGIVMLGPPGSGKGTQGSLLAERLGVPHISTGEVLRQEAGADTELGRQVRAYIERGELVPDDLADEVIDRVLAEARAGGGYVLDGFPRTPDQALRLGDDDVAVYLALPDEVARERIAARGEGRADDAAPEVVDRRLRVYHEETAPLLDVYRKRGNLVTIDGDRSPDEVAKAITVALAARPG
jgi:adenylate kinase